MSSIRRIRLFPGGPRRTVGAGGVRVGGRAGALIAAAATVAMLMGGIASMMEPAATSPSAASAQATPAGQQSSCIGGGTTTVVTPTIRDCEETEIVVQAEASCPTCRAGVNVVIVMPYWVDDPRWMKSEVSGAIDEVARLQEDEQFGSPVRIGVVRFDHLSSIGTTLRLTEQIRSARSKADARSPDQCEDDGSGACPCVAIIGSLNRAAPHAMNMVREARRDAGLANGDETCDFVLVFAEGSEGTCAGFPMINYARQTIQAGRELEREFGTMLAGCPSTIDENCWATRQMVSSMRYYFEAPQAGGMRGELRNQLELLRQEKLLREVAIVQHLPVGLDYVANSANIPPDAVDVTEQGTELRWSWDRIGVAGPHDVRYRVAPSATGIFTVTGTLDIGDDHNRERQVELPDAVVNVVEPCVPPVTPTATPTDTPTATSTSTASSTPTPAPTDTPTATPTRVPPDLYLPIALTERCDAERRAADVVLVLDASTSMLEDAGGGITKMAASLAAARVFLDQLQLAAGRDRAAIVSFNAQARIVQGLTQDRAALESALGAIVLAQQTCLPCAVDTAEAALDLGSAGDRVRTKTMILLTDGRSNPRPVAEAVERAALAKSRGVLIFTIGIGQELDVDALREMATEEQFFFQSPDAGDLERIYLEIASLIPCPAFWPKIP